jgi:fatty acid desaturase
MSVTIATSASPLVRERRQRNRELIQSRTQSYTVLARQVKSLGLNDRTRWFYLLVFVGLIGALGGAFTGLVLLNDSWFQLLIAAALGVIFTQFAFLGHEASHRQILASGPANDRIGRIVSTFLVGISYSWWMNKHTRHHGNPNKVGRDPDLDPDTVVFLEQDAAETKGLHAWIVRRQGWLFFPLLLLFGLGLHQASFRGLLTRRPVEGRWLELGMLAVRFGVYLLVLFWLLPIGLAFAFLGVQLAVFGLYMGAAFAPNHVGMRIVPREAKLDFLDKQVSTSRNVSGGWWATLLMGGLNYQIEHHLFPSMPRPSLSRTRTLVREHCRQAGLDYAETSLASAWGIVIRHLNGVGLAAPATFTCATAGRLGGY